MTLIFHTVEPEKITRLRSWKLFNWDQRELVACYTCQMAYFSELPLFLVSQDF